MKDPVYKLIELTGTSTTSVEDAVDKAIKRAHKTIKNLYWFQVVETRGNINKGKVDRRGSKNEQQQQQHGRCDPTLEEQLREVSSISKQLREFDGNQTNQTECENGRRPRSEEHTS